MSTRATTQRSSKPVIGVSSPIISLPRVTPAPLSGKAASPAATAASQPSTSPVAPKAVLLPAQEDFVDGQNLLVYGFPKFYKMLDYTQGDAIPGYRGTCGETSIANLLAIAGRKVTEGEVLQKAIDNGWCDTISTSSSARGGISGLATRELLASYGVATEVLNDWDPEKFAGLIKQGRGVLLGVNGGELWGATLSPALHNWINANHKINLTGVAYSAETGELKGFYIADSARGLPSDAARYISLGELNRVAHFAAGCDVIYTRDPIKKPGDFVIPVIPAELKPIHTVLNGKYESLYGNPMANRNLNFSQGHAVPGYENTAGQACVANIATLAGLTVSEKDVVEKSIAEKQCDTTSESSALRGSTTAAQQMALLREYGISSTVSMKFDPEQVAESIKAGKGVIVNINRNLLEQPNQPGDRTNADHTIVITGVSYSDATNEITCFYIADSGRGLPIDTCRYFTKKGMQKITNVDGVYTITTTEPIKLHKPNLGADGAGKDLPLQAGKGNHSLTGNSVISNVSVDKPALPAAAAGAPASNAIKPPQGKADPTVAAPPTPQRDHIAGQDVLVYGNPKAYLNLNYRQGNAVTGYKNTAGEVCVANISVLAGRPVSEKEVVEKAIKEKLCDTNAKNRAALGGTTAEQQLALLKEFGFASTLENGVDEASIARHIIEGKGVIISVNDSTLTCATERTAIGRADHVVTVTGAAYSAETGDLAGFYIANSGQGLAGDDCRFISLDLLRAATKVAGAMTITTNDAIKAPQQRAGTTGDIPLLSPVNTNVPGLTRVAGTGGPTTASLIGAPSQADVARRLDSFTPPAPFGDDAGPLKKLPGVAIRKKLALDASTRDLSLGDGNLNGTGNFLDNRITGNDADNILDGLGGADTMIGGKGNDSYYVDNAGDQIVERPGEGVDTVYTTVSTSLSANVENLVLLDSGKPQSAMVNGVNVLVYGYPKSYQLDYDQGNAVPGYRGTCGDTSVANVTMLGGRPASEQEVVERAIKEHLCNTADMNPDRRGGINPQQELALLKELGFASTLQAGFDATSVARSIKDGKGVTLGVNASRLWNTGSTDDMTNNHCITVTGVACAATSGDIVGFYIADSGRGLASDASRFVTLPQLLNATDVGGAVTVTTNEPIKLRGQNLDAAGNELGNILVGNRGDNLLTGGRGNDLLMGGAGNDTYLFAKGDGQDVVYEHDATKGNIDTIKFSDANQNVLRFSHTGNDLTISVSGTRDQVIVKDWYVGGVSGTDNHVERIKTADGKTLYDTDVEKLVQSMASFAPPVSTPTTLTSGQQERPATLLSVAH